MPTRIKLLSESVANKISAGEVVERPASVLKELIENSLDAQATQITVEVRRGGKALVKVVDDGEGMSQADALLALERHATSKIATEADIYRLNTLGFRGEALPSIAAVSKMRIVTRPAEQLAGTEVEVEGGKIIRVKDAGCAPGTTVEVRSLFYNTPARLKFMRATDTEFAHITETLRKLAVAYHRVKYSLFHDGKVVMELLPAPDPMERLLELIGKEAYDQMVPFAGDGEGIAIRGFTTLPAHTRATPSGLHLFVNRRWVRDRLIAKAISEAYSTLIPRERYPVTVVLVEMDPGIVDINVHPTKAEVRFREPSHVYQALLTSLRAALSEVPVRREVAAALKAWETIRFEREMEGEGWHHVPARQGEMGDRPPVIEEVPILPRRFFSGLDVIGQARSSFIICQSAGHLILIDQHAAHERVVYEKLKGEIKVRRIPSQELLYPIQVEVSYREAALLDKHGKDLKRLGFEVEPFGGNCYVIRSVPEILGQADYRSLLLDLLDQLSESGEGEGLERVADRVLMTMACHQVVRANSVLDRQQIQALLEQLDGIDFSASCPHGRPVWRQISFQEIERMFRR